MPFYKTNFRFAEFTGLDDKSSQFSPSIKHLKELSKELELAVKNETAKSSGKIIEKAEASIGMQQRNVSLLADELESTVIEMEEKYKEFIREMEEHKITISYKQEEKWW